MSSPKQRTLQGFFSKIPSPTVGAPRLNTCIRKPLFSPSRSSFKRKRKGLILDLDSKQMTLDAGQRLIGMQHCNQCGMVYSIDDVKDVESHDHYHNRHTALNYVKVTSVLLHNWKRSGHYLHEGDFHFFRVRSNDVSTLRQKIEKMVENLVNEAVGYCHDLSVWGSTRSRTAFVCIYETDSSFHIGGVILAEILNEAFWEKKNEVLHSGDCILGVNRIWTHSQARKQGIARSLLDYARSNILVGGNIEREMVAFSEPTSDGKKFAEKYIGREDGDFLMYNLQKESH